MITSEAKSENEPLTNEALKGLKPLGLREVAEILGKSVQATWADAKAGRIPAVQVGNRWMVPRIAFEQFLRGELKK